MAIRTCPICFGKVPSGDVAAYSDGITCPRCGKSLEVSRPSRLLGTTIGLAAAFLAYRLSRHAGGMLGWVLPIVYSFLAYSVVAPVFLLLTGDLVVRPDAPYAEPVAASPNHAHGGGHH